MITTAERRADARRDVLALITAYLDRDGEAVEAITAAQEDGCWPLACEAVAMLTAVVASGYDVRAWVAAMREAAEGR